MKMDFMTQWISLHNTAPIKCDQFYCSSDKGCPDIPILQFFYMGLTPPLLMFEKSSISLCFVTLFSGFWNIILYEKTVRLIDWGLPKSPIMLPIHVFIWNNSSGLIENIDWRLMTKHTEEKHKRFRFLLNGRRGHWSSLNIHSYEHKGRLSLCFLFNQQT